MSGILQRIAASAIRPQPRVHPFVESIFAAPHEEGFAAPILQQQIQSAGVLSPNSPTQGGQASQSVSVEESAVETPIELLNQRSAQHGTRVPPLTSAASAPGSASLPTAVVAVGRESFQPLLPLPAPPKQEKEARTLPLQATAVPESAARPTAQEWPSSANPADASSPAWSFAPLVYEVGDDGSPTSAVAAGAARSGIAARRDSPVPASSAVPGRGYGSAARNDRGQRTPQPHADEIQIHIGRIEVIATPPPAPRVVPTPARRSQSLDEYLRRSNGRAG
jgi:hypothetical protein